MRKLIFAGILVLLIIFASGCVQKNAPAVQTANTENQGQAEETPVEPGQVEEAHAAAVVAIPESVEKNCIGFVIGAPDEMQLISEIGGAWARPHPGPFAWGFIEPEKGRFDFSTTDEYVKAAQENNIAILATLWPFADWDQKTCHKAECEVTQQDIFYPREKMGRTEGIPKSRCAPCSYNEYQEFISTLVERYDGDGSTDMPGLKMPIKYWEILNEPEMKGEDMTFFKGSEAEYVEIFTKTEESIKKACPDCKVLHAGAAGVQDFMLEYWSRIFDSQIDFDIANIHCIRGSDLSTLNVKGFKQLLQEKNIDKEIWVTEAQYNSDGEISSSVTNALNTGASKIFFTQFQTGRFGPPEAGKYSEAYKGIAMKCK